MVVLIASYESEAVIDRATRRRTVPWRRLLNIRSVARVSRRRNATSSLPLTRASARSREYWLETVISILGSSSRRSRIAAGSQSISFPVRKPSRDQESTVLHRRRHERAAPEPEHDDGEEKTA